MPNLIPIFLTGLITGGLTCLAVQGGLLAVSLAQNEEEKLIEKTGGSQAFFILAFLGAKLIAYTILGLLLGQLGSFFQLSITTRAVLQFLVAIFMVGTALNLLNVHPLFRYFVIQPPRFLTRIIKNQSRSKSVFAPALLGAFTVFIPCGTTQAMMALAVASGNPLFGALILFSFILGTSPLFFVLGYFATRLGEALHRQFLKVAAVGIILLAVFNLNNAMALGLGFTFNDFGRSIWCTVTLCPSGVQAIDGKAVSEATINIGPGGYNPNNITVKSGLPVKIKLVNGGGGGCAQAFTIPRLGIQRVVPVGASDLITFIAPEAVGPLPFMCSMGMYRGVINVI